MSSFKYHYKSPDQIREEITTTQISTKRRNKIMMIIFLDIFILSIIAIFMFFSGFFKTEAFTQQESIKIDNIEYSGSVNIHNDKNIQIYLYVLNQKDNPLHFPLDGEQSILLQTLTAQDKIFNLEYKLGQRVIAPGETTIYDNSFQLDKINDIKSFKLYVGKDTPLIFKKSSP